SPPGEKTCQRASLTYHSRFPATAGGRPVSGLGGSMIDTSLSRGAQGSVAPSRRRGAPLRGLLAASALLCLTPGSAIAAAPTDSRPPAESKPASDAGPAV